MEPKLVKIEVYYKRESATSVIEVEQLSDSVFRMIDNDIFNPRLRYGTEFETTLNEDGKHEIKRIITRSGFITRSYILTPQYKEEEYRLLGDEIVKHGGFWQVDFGSLATINLPKDSELDIDEIYKVFVLDEAKPKE